MSEKDYCVYVQSCNQEPFYVGRSSESLNRPFYFGGNHNKFYKDFIAKNKTGMFSVSILHVKTLDESISLEKLLIDELSAKHELVNVMTSYRAYENNKDRLLRINKEKQDIEKALQEREKARVLVQKRQEQDLLAKVNAKQKPTHKTATTAVAIALRPINSKFKSHLQRRKAAKSQMENV